MVIEPPSESGPLSEQAAAAAFANSSLALVLTNPLQPDNPIVYVNGGFERMTGYESAQVLGHNCRFLQGPGTDRAGLDELRRGIAEERESSVDVLNYHADGSPFMNRLLVTPVRDEEGTTTYFLGIQQRLSGGEIDTSRPKIDNALREVQHRVKNHLSMLTGFIRMQARESGASHAFSNLARRVESLQLLYDQLSYPASDQNSGTVALDAYLARIADSVSGLDGRENVHVTTDLAHIWVPTTTAVQIGLLISEIMTNAMQHAFVDRDSGNLTLRAGAREGGGLRMEVLDDGVGLPADGTWPDSQSLGGRIVAGLVEGLDAELHVSNRTEGGTLVALDVPETRDN